MNTATGSSGDPRLSGTWRVLDANCNRLREGLRVIEDVYRFCQPDPAILKRCKDVRHRFGGLTRRLPYRELLQARDVAGDAGQSVAGQLNSERHTVGDVLRANFARATEAARVLEEFSAATDPGWRDAIQEIRFTIYQLEKDIGLATTEVSLTTCTEDLP